MWFIIFRCLQEALVNSHTMLVCTITWRYIKVRSCQDIPSMIRNVMYLAQMSPGRACKQSYHVSMYNSNKMSKTETDLKLQIYSGIRYYQGILSMIRNGIYLVGGIQEVLANSHTISLCTVTWKCFKLRRIRNYKCIQVWAVKTFYPWLEMWFI